MEHVFDEMEIGADPFALCELQGRCDLGLGRRPTATFHYILTGEGEILVSGSPPISIKAGSLVMVPALRSHVLRSFGDKVEPAPDCQLVAELDLDHHLAKADDNGENRLLALCANVKIGLRGARELIDLIREPLAVTISVESPLRETLGSLLREISTPRLGSRAMIRALLLQCMIHLLRDRITAHDQALDWMRALQDTSVWPALREMLDDPGAPHSVASLANLTGMSRSAFAKRFTAAYGSGPMDLLRDLRMRLAASMLSQSTLPVKRIAALVGFRSRSAFSRAFEDAANLSPRAFRANLTATSRPQSADGD